MIAAYKSLKLMALYIIFGSDQGSSIKGSRGGSASASGDPQTVPARQEFAVPEIAVQIK